MGALLRREWQALLEREGTGAAAPIGVEFGDDEEMPCPACGNAAPLIEGACGECGLQLE